MLSVLIPKVRQTRRWYSPQQENQEAAVADDELTTEDFDVQTTPVAESIVCRGKDFSMFADYAGRAYVRGATMLSAKTAASSPRRPCRARCGSSFSVYMRANSESAPESFVVSKEEEYFRCRHRWQHRQRPPHHLPRWLLYGDCGQCRVRYRNIRPPWHTRGIAPPCRRTQHRGTSAGIYIVDGLKVIM